MSKPKPHFPFRSLRFALGLAAVCVLSFAGWRVSASEANATGNWLSQLKSAPAAVWAAVFQGNTETVSKNGVAGATPPSGNGTTTINWTINYDLTSSNTPLANVTLNDTWNSGQTLITNTVQTPGNNWTSSQPNSTVLNFTNALLAKNAKGVAQAFPRPLGGSINLSGTGDGFNPAVTANGKVIGINHHVNPASVWCYDLNTAAPCTGYPKSSGIQTGTNNYTLAIGNRVYMNPDSYDQQCCGAPGLDRIYCWDATTNSTCGQSPSTTGKSAVLTVANGKLFTLNQSGELRCFDPDNSLNNCAGFTPVNLGMPARGGAGQWDAFGDDIFAIGSKLYIANYQRKLTCFDAATNTTCTGWPALPTVLTPATPASEGSNLFPRLSAGGAVTGICIAGRNTNATCYDLDSSNPTVVNLGGVHGMRTGINANADVYLGSRVFFPNYNDFNKLSCFDWATQLPCTGAGFTSGFTVDANRPYGLGTDGVSVYSYGDAAVLRTWNPISGVSPSTRAATTATVNIDSFYCGSGSQVAATWDKVILSDINLTSGVEFTSLQVSLINVDTGATVFGPTEAVGGAGVIDISSVSSSIRNLRLQIDETPVATVAWDDNVAPKASLTFTNNTPVQFCYQTQVTCAGSAANYTDTINTNLDPKSVMATVSACAASPSLTLAKSAPSPSLVAGTNSTYTLTVTNNGSAAATTATVKDGLPIGLDLVSAAGTNWACSPSGATATPVGTITCTFSGGSIATGGGTSTISVVVKPTAPYGGNTVINYASVDPSGGTNPPTPTTCTAANTPAGCAAPVSSSIPNSPHLSVSKSNPALALNQNSTYTLTVTNNGNAAATVATVKDALPVGMKLVSATGTGWTCTPSSGNSPVGTITCTFSGSIATGGGTSMISVVACPTISGTFTNKVSVEPAGGTGAPDPTTCTGANQPSAGCGAPVTNTVNAPPTVASDAGSKLFIGRFGQNAIARVNIDGTGVVPNAITSSGTVLGFALDQTRGKIYWTDFTANGHIGRANMDGTGLEPNFISGAVFPNEVAVDLATGQIYWSQATGGNAATNGVWRANADGTGVTQFLTITGGDYGIDVAGGKLYYFPNDGTRNLSRINLDGTGSVPNFLPAVGNGSGTSGLAVDTVNQKIYFGTNTGSTIGCANLDGSGINLNFATTGGAGNDPAELAVDPIGGYLYYTAYRTGNIGRVALNGSNNNTAFITSLTGTGVVINYGLDIGSADFEAAQATRTGTYSDPDGNTVTISANIGSVTQTGTSSGTWTWTYTPPDGPVTIPVTITATDSNNALSTTSFTVGVLNITPTIVLTGNSSVSQNATYTLNLGAITDPGNDTVTAYSINWGDGTTENFNVHPTGQSKTHSYTTTGSKTISVSLTDEDGTHTNAGTKTVAVTIPLTTIGFHTASGALGNYYNGGTDAAGNTGTNSGIVFNTTNAASGGVLDGNSNPVISVPNGFTTGFAVDAINVAIGFNITIFDGENATGTQLASQSYNLNGNITGSVTFAGTAKSVRLAKFSGGPGYDNLTFGASTVGTPINEPPGVTTNAATSVAATTATLNATINPGGAATTVQFEYGTTTSYGSTASITLSPNNGTTGQSVSANIMGLTGNTTYHFRVTGTNSVGSRNGGDLMFTTPPPNNPPTVASDAGSKLFIGRVVANPASVARVNTDGTGLTLSVVNSTVPVYGVAVDSVRGKVYFTSHTGDRLSRANLDGTGLEANFITVTTGAGATGLAIDLVNSHLYWAQAYAPNGGGIMRANLDGTGVTQILSGVNVYDIALNVAGNKIYYAGDFSFSIGRCDLNGANNNRNWLANVGGVSGVVNGMSGLAVDLTNGKLYWSRSNGIGQANLDGSSIVNPFITLTNGSIDIVADPITSKLFWTRGGGVVGCANLNGTNVNESLVTGLTAAWGIDLASTDFEGTVATRTGTYSDPDGNTVTISANIGSVTKTGTSSGTWTWTYTPPDGPATLNVTITATDSNAAASTTSFVDTVLNVAPTATFAASSTTANEGTGTPPSVSFTNPVEPGTTDTSTGLKYSYDYNNDGTWDTGDGTFAGSISAASQAIPASYFAAPAPAQRVVKGRIIDKDGGSTDYTATITINHAPTAINGPLAIVEDFDYGASPGTLSGNGGAGFSTAWNGGSYTPTSLSFSNLSTVGGAWNGSSGSRNFAATLAAAGPITGDFLFSMSSAAGGRVQMFGLGGINNQGFTIALAPANDSTPTGGIPIVGLQGGGFANITAGAVALNTTYMYRFAYAGSFITAWILTAAQYDNFAPDGITDAELNAASIGSGATQVTGRVTKAGAVSSNMANLFTYTFGGSGVVMDRLRMTGQPVGASLVIAENAAVNTSAGTLLASDQDAGDSATFELVPGTGDTDNASFTISGNTVRSATVFNYEVKNSYSIRVKVTDSGGLTYETPLTVTISNVNEAVTDLALNPSSIAENNAPNATVGTLSATDTDTGDTHTFTLVSGTGSTNNGSFTITGNTLKLTPSADYETKSSYALRVRATDVGGLFFEKELTVTITDVPEEFPPTITRSNAAVTVNEGSIAANSGTFNDANGNNTVLLSASLGTVTKDDALGTWSWTYTAPDGPDGPTTVTITANDGVTSAVTTTFTLAVNNVAPKLNSCAPPSFTLVNTTIGGWAAAPGDFDGDGNQDIVMGYPGGGISPVPFRNNGNGTFTQLPTLPNAARVVLTPLIADYNGDGKLDIAVDQGNSYKLYFGDGAFGSSSSVNVGSGGAEASGAVADLNGDDKPDFVIGINRGNGDNNGQVTVRLNNGSGGFPTQTQYLIGPGEIFVTVADFNGDSKRDIAAADSEANTVTILLNDGAGNFTPAAGGPISVGTAPKQLAAGDFNNDGKQDLAVPNSGSNNVSILLGNGAGGFATAVNYAAGTGAKFVLAADFNNDGVLDLGVGLTTGVALLGATGGGSFGAPTVYGTSQVINITLADMNADGGQDILVGFSDLVRYLQANVAPTVVTVNEGVTAMNSGTFCDPGADTVTISASVGTVTQNDGAGTWSWSYPTNDGPAQNQMVTITATDSDNATKTYTFNLVVNNLNPTATFANGGAVNEGSTGTVSFTSPADASTVDTSAGFHYAYDFDNDGTFDSGDGTYAGSGSTASATVPASFLADGNGSRIVKGRILDKDGGFTDSTTTITINNVAPTIALTGNSAVDINTVYTLNLGTITDPGADTVTGYSINWGDGVTEPFSGNPANTSKTHTYTSGGSQTITVSLTDEDGTVTGATKTVNVNTFPVLAVSKSQPTPTLIVGQNSTYTITVSNSGSASATTAQVKDALPDGMKLISATGSGWTCTPSSGNPNVGTITCSFSGSIAATNGTSTISVVVCPTVSGSVTNYVSVDPTSGTNAPDPAICTALNTPTAGCGAPVTSNGSALGAALDFDGLNDYVSVPNNAALHPPNAIAIEAWVKPTGGGNFARIADNSEAILLSKWGGSNTFTFVLVVNGVQKAIIAPTPWVAGTWYHVVGTYDGNSLKLYVNGVLIDSVAAAGPITTSNNALLIGLGHDPYYFQGQLDELRLWNRALCQDEIQAHINCELLTTETGLAAYYKFNQGIAGGSNTGINTLTDSGPNGFTGTLNNFSLSGATSNWVTPGGVTTGTTCAVFLAPEIDVRGNGNPIADGSPTPSPTNDTDFGSANVASGSGTHTFTITNTGTRQLLLGGTPKVAISGAHASDFTVTLQPTSPVAATNGTTTFTIVFDPSGVGTRTATVTIENDDCDEGPYNFSIQGTGANLPPMITAGTTITRQQGTAGSSATIATVSDDLTAAGSVVVTATTVPTGISITGISNSGGTITATVAALCNATPGNNTIGLTATDGHGAMATANFIVNVTANSAPIAGNYANTGVGVGGTVTVTPDAAPMDNGSIQSVTAAGSAGFTGTFSVNTSTGALTITNAGPSGTHTITVTVTDNCNVAVQRTFTLTVNTAPTISVNAITRQQGVPVSNSTIANVSDQDQAANTLTVKVNGNGTATVNGVTVSNLVIAANGAVTADVVADCAVTLGNASFTLTVSDSSSATNTAMLVVTVTANTPPTLGNYANTGPINVGTGTTVTPSTAPADNVSVLSASASASNFTGTFSVSPTTGVVTITNAGPPGTYTVNVKVTDNCNEMTIKSFQLVINGPPTVTPGAMLTRQQGTAGSNSTLATLGDDLTAAGSLTLALVSAPTGLTVTNLLNTGGTVTANVTAGCALAMGPQSFVIKATDAGGLETQATINVTVTANTEPVLSYLGQTATAGQPLTVNPATGPSDNGSVSTIVVQSQGGFTGTVSVDNVTGVVTLTNANPTGTHTLIIRATDNCGLTRDASFTVAIGCPFITVSPATLPAAITGESYAQTITQMGGIGTTTFSLSVGTLPNGLTLSSAGLLSGTPTQTGSFPITVRATDSNQCFGETQYTLVVTCPTTIFTPASANSPTALPAAVAGQPYNQTFSAVPARTYNFTISAGTLPNGLTLNATSGVLSGTPLQTGPFNFTVKAKDQYNCESTHAYTLSVGCQSFAVNPATLPGGQAGVPYQQAFTTTGSIGALSFSLNSGVLPPGLTLSNGVLSGTPTTLGSFSFEIKATDGNGCLAFRTYSNVQITCPTFALSALPAATAGVAYNQSIGVTPNIGGPHGFSVAGTLPPGLTLSNAGALSGTPTTAGTYNFTVDMIGSGAFSGCTGSKNYSLIVNCQTITLTPNLPSGVQGMAYNQTITASPGGGAYTYAVVTNTLPPGLSLNSATGAITGIPSAPGNYAFSIKAMRWGTCTGTQNYNVTITGTCAALTVNPATLPPPTLGTPYSQIVSATGGTGPYTFALTQGTLPGGLALNANSGLISGTPTASGTFSFRVTATAQGGCTGSRTYVVMIACPAVTFSPAAKALPNGRIGAAYTQTITATPANNYTYSIQLGQLPHGFTLNAVTGVISGITDQTGLFNFTIKVQGAGCQATKAYTITIQTNASALAQINDYDGDAKSDLALRAANGEWRLLRSSDQQALNLSWGAEKDLPVSGDYDGDGKTDLAVFRPSDGTWHIKHSSDDSVQVKAWGVGTDIPVPGDYDGDGKTDLAVWRGAEGIWYIWRSRDQQYELARWGAGAAPFNDIPVQADYDGDGRTDLAVFRRNDAQGGVWYVRLSGNGSQLIKQWGIATDVPVVNDYDGDGKADLAVWRSTEGIWYILPSTTGTPRAQTWGAGYAPYFDQALPGDYDGDGQTDLAVWRATNATWYLLLSASETSQATRIVGQGQTSDVPVNVRRP